MKKLKKPILAEGEKTGHCHILNDNTIEVFEREDGIREFLLKKQTEVQHQEHLPITIPINTEPIKFQSGIVQEYDHFTEESKRVRD